MAVLRLRPVATVRNDGWLIAPGAETPHESVDEDPFDAADGLITYINAISSNNLIVLYFFEPPPQFSTLTSAKFIYEARQEAAGSGYNGIVYSGSSSATDSIQTPTSFTERSWTNNTDPATAATWTRNGLAAAFWGVEAQGDSGPTVQKTLTRCYLELDIVIAPTQIGQARIIASSLLRLLHRPPRSLGLDVPPRFMDLQALNEVDISHFAGPSANGSGWGVASANRRRFFYLGGQIDLRDFKASARVWDPKHYLVSMAYGFIGARESSPVQQGIPKLLNRGGEKLTRANDGALCFDPSSGKLTYKREDEPLDDKRGRLISDTVVEKVRNNCFAEGIATSWTTVGGANGGSASAETDDIAAEPDVSTTALRLQAGNPLGGISKDQTTSSTYTTGAKCVLAVLHKDLSGSACRVGIQNTGSGNWLRQDLTWGAEQHTALPVRSEWALDTLEFTNDTSTATLKVRVLSELVASQVNLYQLVDCYEYQYWIGGLKTSSTADTTKGADDLSLEALTSKYPFSPDAGTIFIDIETLWTDAHTGDRVLAVQAYDASNSHQIYWVASSSEFRFRIRAAGSNYDAGVSGLTIAKGDLVRIVGRYTDVAKEDLLALKHDIWVSINGGAWQTSGPVTHVKPTKSPPDTAQIGSSGSGANVSNVYWRRIFAAPTIYSQTELQRMPLF